jgi:hypothetical protein
MCDSCPTHLLGPGEVAGKVARSKAGRKAGSVLFYGTVWTFGPLMIAGIIVYTLGWWLVPITLGLLALAAVAVRALRGLQRHAVVVAPASLRAALPAPRRAVALPRNLSVTRRRRALPAPAKALPAAEVVGRVVPAPARGKVVR